MTDQLKIIILAAGKGTRMKSELAKVLHKVSGKEMVNLVLDTVAQVQPDEVYLVIGHQSDQVKAVTAKHKGLIYVEQKEQLGTGHAVMVVEPALKNYNGKTIILCGDVPLLKPETIRKLVEVYQKQSLGGVILTVKLPDPKHYGRIIRDKHNLVSKIVEFRDATDAEKAVNEINSGIYCFNTQYLFDALKKIKNTNDQKEYYLTDVIEIIIKAGKKIGTYIIEDELQVHGVNDLDDLQKAEAALSNLALDKN